MIEKGKINGLELQSDWSIAEDSFEVVRGSANFICDFDKLSSVKPNIGDKHPKDSDCEVVDVQISGMANNQVLISCQYLGLRSRQSKWRYTYNVSLNEEAIEAHPDASSLVGTKESPQNDATFDKDGNFTGFKASSDLAGVRGYLTGNITIRRTCFADSILDGIANVFKTRSIASNSIPGVDSSRDALQISYSNNKIGNFFEINEEYLISDNGGKWNTQIYSKVGSIG